jgi:hypothetical protein
MEDRQKYKRASLHHSLELQFPGESTKITAKATDIGYGGIGLHCPKRLPVGQEVLVTIGFPNSDLVLQFETVAGTVRWCRTQGFGYVAGIKFKKFVPDEHPRLTAFLEQIGLLGEGTHHLNALEVAEE